jgi:hypothetical protein
MVWIIKITSLKKKKIGKSPERASLIEALFEHITSYTLFAAFTTVFASIFN